MSNPIEDFKQYFFSLNPYEISILGNIIGIMIASTLNNNQQNTMGNFLELVGQQILTIQAQGSSLNSNSNYVEYLNSLNFKVEYLENMINYFKKIIGD